MKAKLTAEKLDVRLNELDTRPSNQGLPLRFRPLQCFKAIYGSVPDGPLRQGLFDPITAWFIARHGDRVLWDGFIGRLPVIVRGEVYLGLIPGISGDACVKTIDHVKDLPREVAATLTEEELEHLGQRMSGATAAFQHLHNLSIDDTFLNETERGLVWRGLFDLENAAYSLRHSGDTQNAIFHSHAAAEKFLKVALARSGDTTDLQSLRHSLPRIFEKLVAVESRYDWLRSSVEELQKFAPNMQIRYGVVPRTVQNAIIGFSAALSICGTLAIIWLFDLARGSNQSTFTPGTFYLDGSKTTFYCKEVVEAAEEGKLALLTRFDVNPVVASVMIDMAVKLKYSALYLEVKDIEKIEDLRRRLEYQMRNRGKGGGPKDFRIKVTSGPEGSYTTAHVRVRVDRKN